MSTNSPRFARAALVVAFVVIGIGAYFFAQRNPGPRSVAPTPDSAAENAAADPRGPGEVAGDPESAPLPPSVPTRAPVDPNALVLPRAKVWLTGIVRSKSTPMHQVTLITMPSLGNGERSTGLGRALTAKPAADGAFSIDISRAFALGAPFPKVILLQATRESGSSNQIEVPVDFDASFLERDTPVRLTAEIELPETCRATGKAWLMGDLTQTVQVAAFELVDGLPQRHAAALGVADASEHVFELPLVCGRDYIVVAYREGYRPRIHRLGSEDLYTVDAFALEPGEPIRGVAEFRGAPVRGRVAASWSAAGRRDARYSAGSASFVWSGEQFEWAEVTAEIGANGDYELLGLAPLAYEVVLAHVSGVAARRPAAAVVQAPADDVRLTPELAELRLVITQGGKAHADKLVALTERTSDGRTRSLSARTDGAGVAVVWLAPLAQIEIETCVKATATSGAVGTSTTVLLGD